MGFGMGPSPYAEPLPWLGHPALTPCRGGEGFRRKICLRGYHFRPYKGTMGPSLLKQTNQSGFITQCHVRGVVAVPLVILLFALFASLFTLSKTALDFSEPFFLIGSRMAFAGLLLLTHQFIFNRKAFKIKSQHIVPLVLLGLISIYVTNIAEIWGIQFMSSAKACLIYSLSPFIAAIVAFWMLKEASDQQEVVRLMYWLCRSDAYFVCG